MRILHVESEADAQAEMIATCTIPAEIVVHFAESGEEAISILLREPYDAIVISHALQDFEGTALIRRLRACRVRVPIILVAPETTPQYRARALWDGADDIMHDPWDRDEMVARLKNLSRRFLGHNSSTLVLGGVTIHQERMEITVDHELVHMTEKEYLLLELLALKRGRVCTKSEIMNHLYGGLDEPEEKIIDVFICKIRRKLGRHGSMLATVWGKGYRVEPALLPAQAA